MEVEVEQRSPGAPLLRLLADGFESGPVSLLAVPKQSTQPSHHGLSLRGPLRESLALSQGGLFHYQSVRLFHSVWSLQNHSIVLWTLLPILWPVGIANVPLFASNRVFCLPSDLSLQYFHNHHRQIIRLRLFSSKGGNGLGDMADQCGRRLSFFAHNHFF
jgi:hypothetical protein